MTEKLTMRALLGAGIASAMLAASAAGAFAANSDEKGPADPETGITSEETAEGTTSADSTDGSNADDATAEVEVQDEPAEPDAGMDEEKPSDESPAEGDPDEDGSFAEDATENDATDEKPVEGDDNDDDDGSDGDDSVKDIVEAPTVSSFAEGQMDAKAEWTVTKRVINDTKKVTGKPGSTAKVPYRVEASATGVLSNIKVSGEMSVKNEDERDLVYTLEAAVLKGLDPEERQDLETILGSKCTFSGTDVDPNMPGFQVKVASGKSLSITYTCTAPNERVSGPELVAAPLSFWAYVKAISAMGFEPEAWADSYFMVEFNDVELQDRIIEILDVNSEDIGGEAVSLGVGDALGGTHIFEYTMNVSIPNQGCYDFDNVALAVNEYGDVVAGDSATIEGCAEAPQGTEQTEIKPTGVITKVSSGSQGGGLAATGADSTMLGAIGATMVSLGALAFGLTRRARKA